MSDERMGGEYEHGWVALRGLDGRTSPRLTLLQAQRDFSPIGPWEMVLVEACPLCADGGLRMAGYFRRGRHLLAVRQCDTCQAVAVGSRFFAGAFYPGAGTGEPDDGRDRGYDDRDDDDEGNDGSDWRRYG